MSKRASWAYFGFRITRADVCHDTIICYFFRSKQGGYGQEWISCGRIQRRLSLGRDRIDYEYKIENIDDDNKDNFNNFEKGETTSTSDSANDDAEVLMIPDISIIISSGDGDDSIGVLEHGRVRWWQQQRVLWVGREDVDDR